jgi:hypothetical protein
MSKHHKEMYTEMEALEERCAKEPNKASPKKHTNKALFIVRELLIVLLALLIVVAIFIKPVLLLHFVGCYIILSTLSNENK